MHRDEIIDGALLPLKYTSFTTAFRAEAGSAGRDTRGILRQHQFNKVELIKITNRKNLTTNSKNAARFRRSIETLEIPYRVVELCTGDMGFAMAKTYDIEVWLRVRTRTAKSARLAMRKIIRPDGPTSGSAEPKTAKPNMSTL